MSGAFDTQTLWIVIVGMAVGCYGLRFVFIGLVGSRVMPGWLMRHLRYTAVAMLPALVTPLVVWPAATGGAFDTPRFAAAAVTITAGYLTRNVVAGIALGAITLYGLLYLIGSSV